MWPSTAMASCARVESPEPGRHPGARSDGGIE